MKRNEEETRKQWTERIAEWHSSGISAVEFARKHGCSKARLYYWEAKLKGVTAKPTQAAAAATGGGPRLMRVVTRAAGARPGRDGELVVEVASARIRVTRDFDGEFLGAVVRALSGGGQ